MRFIYLSVILLCSLASLQLSAQMDCEDGYIREHYNIELCPGESFNGYDISGQYLDTTAIGPFCDLISVYNIAIYAVTTDIITPNRNFCSETDQDSVFQLYSIEPVGGCPYIPNIDLEDLEAPISYDTLCAGQNNVDYDPGIYLDLQVGVTGCDSALLLVILEEPADISNTYTLCEIQNMMPPLVDLSGETITEVGFHTRERTTPHGCTYLEEIEVTAAFSPVDLTLDTTICSGSYLYGLTESGTYTVERKDLNGCKYNILVDLVVQPSPPDVTTNLYFCENEFDGNFPDPEELTDANGCTYLNNFSIFIYNNNSTEHHAEICEGEEYQGHTTSGTYTEVLIDGNGCDSIIILELTVIPLADCETATNDIQSRDEIYIIPNPSSANIRITCSNKLLSGKPFRIIDNLGKEVLRAKHLPSDGWIDISLLSPGSYFFVMDLEGQRITKRIIKI